jgi:hypothetical protein
MIDEHASLTEEAKQQMLASVGDDDFFEPSVEYPAKVARHAVPPQTYKSTRTLMYPRSLPS